MGAPDLLQLLREAGLTLTLTPAGGLHVAPRAALTDDHREAIRAELDALKQALAIEAAPAAPMPGSGGVVPMTESELQACHAGGWDSTEIEVFLLREDRFHRRGRADAEDLAERLVLRDRQRDDRRLCLECVELRADGLCQAAARGELPYSATRVQPVPTILHRCSKFALAPGLR